LKKQGYLLLNKVKPLVEELRRLPNPKEKQTTFDFLKVFVPHFAKAREIGYLKNMFGILKEQLDEMPFVIASVLEAMRGIIENTDVAVAPLFLISSRS
jgi:hypothetical protein